MEAFNSLKKYTSRYNRRLGIENTYANYEPKLNKDIPHLDITAYRMFPDYQFVYDKLFIANSQNIKAGDLRELHTIKPAYPFFIKPRYGHKTSSSKDCYKISSQQELVSHLHKNEMMWSEFINAREGMTDFVLINGEIVYQLTYKYSKKQNGFADDWKYISPDTQPPPEIVSWVKRYMIGYTGALNVQYRSTIIIEVGLRFARGGIYIESTGNPLLVRTINDMWIHKTWNQRNQDKLKFEPYYSFKCWSPLPVVYLLPHHIIYGFLKRQGVLPLHDYYFEPTGTHSCIFYQFLHKDFKKGMQAKKQLERTVIAMNIIILTMVIVGILGIFISPSYGYGILLGASLLWITSLINPLSILIKQMKHQQQFFM
jgi:hypothetical protein